MTVLGVDPGTAVMGYGVVTAGGTGHAVHLVECGVVRTRPDQPLGNRLAILFDGISELLERHRPDAVAVEGLFHGRNARSALVLGHARGVVLLAATRAGITVAEISPAEVKRAVTGTGAATKPQVGAMVMRLLHLTASPSPADAADGVAIALTHLLRAEPRARMAVRR
ncbi:MAG: crossover junction endodeoxyribonuclease RuvC [Gemmatimonadales bacterium]